MTSTQPLVQSDPDILGGTPVFVGTRVPASTLLNYLSAGDSLEVFLDHFPTVSREQVEQYIARVSIDRRRVRESSR